MGKIKDTINDNKYHRLIQANKKCFDCVILEIIHQQLKTKNLTIKNTLTNNDLKYLRNCSDKIYINHGHGVIYLKTLI